MAIKANFTQADVRKHLEAFLKVIESRIIKRLQNLGEKCVTHARGLTPPSSYTDRSGNLKSSIGYAIFKDGSPIFEDYQPLEGVSIGGKPFDGRKGVQSGKDLAYRIGSTHKDGFTLVVTAGMDYAVYVESTGRDVLTSAEMLARQEFPKMMEALVRNINKALE